MFNIKLQFQLTLETIKLLAAGNFRVHKKSSLHKTAPTYFLLFIIRAILFISRSYFNNLQFLGCMSRNNTTSR